MAQTLGARHYLPSDSAAVSGDVCMDGVTHPMSRRSLSSCSYRASSRVFDAVRDGASIFVVIHIVFCSAVCPQEAKGGGEEEEATVKSEVKLRI
jgi:hypothetical protein